MIPIKPFYMIRHGESIANRDGYFSGNLDVALTNKGRDQAEAARMIVERLPVQPTIIIHSHLSRAKDTAAIINTNLKLNMLETPLLGEHQFGDWEKEQWDKVRPAFMAGKNPPNGETIDAFSKRVKSGFIYALERDELPLIVCHGGVFRGLYGNYGQDKHGVENCALYHFTPIDSKDFPWKMALA